MKKLIFALIITNPYNSFSNDNSELSLYCNFKFSEYKSINTELPKCHTNPEKFVQSGNVVKLLKLNFPKCRIKQYHSQNGIVKNKNMMNSIKVKKNLY